MRPSVLWLEQLKYVQKNELSGEALFLDRELSNFVESCRMVLGKALKMTADAEKPLCIFRQSATVTDLSALHGAVSAGSLSGDLPPDVADRTAGRSGGAAVHGSF